MHFATKAPYQKGLKAIGHSMQSRITTMKMPITSTLFSALIKMGSVLTTIPALRSALRSAPRPTPHSAMNPIVNPTLPILPTSIANHWLCVGITERIALDKPYTFHVGELPMVLWRDPTTRRFHSAINICKHMGSSLSNGKITPGGCLQCQYHGLEYQTKDSITTSAKTFGSKQSVKPGSKQGPDTFGQVVEQDGKLFWAYEPIHAKPFRVPFFEHPDYETSFVSVDMDAALLDSALNTMDLRHPEFVHSNGGFGNADPPEDIRHYEYKYKHNATLFGLSFRYKSNPLMQRLNQNAGHTDNFHMFYYPAFSWSKVSFNKHNHLIIGVNLLPLSPEKTRWYITICHNYYKSPTQQQLMKVLAGVILSQDFVQMKNQAKEGRLKQALMLNHVFADEDVIQHIKRQFDDYAYLDDALCASIYRNRG